MKWRHEKVRIPEGAEEELEAAVRKVSGPEPLRPDVPPVYWQNLLIRTNTRIDDVSSGKGITISWAARVAIPGVVAILSFLIGLHYYGPTDTSHRESLTSIVMALPEQTVDSVLVGSTLLDELFKAEAVATPLLDAPEDLLRDYFIENGPASALIETLGEEEAKSIVSLLGTSMD